MPKDAWRKANTRAKYGPIGPKRKHGAKCQQKRKALKRLKNPKRIASRHSPETKLWFGKYKDTQIADVPKSYLQWLVSVHKPGISRNLDGLVFYLSQYLGKNTNIPRLVVSHQ